MRMFALVAALLLAAPASLYAAPIARASGGASKQDCQRGCNKRCHGAKNKSKCVNECRRAC